MKQYPFTILQGFDQLKGPTARKWIRTRGPFGVVMLCAPKAWYTNLNPIFKDIPDTISLEEKLNFAPPLWLRPNVAGDKLKENILSLKEAGERDSEYTCVGVYVFAQLGDKLTQDDLYKAYKDLMAQVPSAEEIATKGVEQAVSDFLGGNKPTKH